MKPFKNLISQDADIKGSFHRMILLERDSILSRLRKHKKPLQLLVPELLPICMKFNCHILKWSEFQHRYHIAQSVKFNDQVSDGS